MQDGLEKVSSKFGEVTAKASKFALAITAVDLALVALVKKTVDVAVGFNKFRWTTGESTDQLQKWQYAARLANVGAQDVVQAITSIQDAQAEIALGAGNVAPWQLLGIDARTNPFDVLWQIHERIQGMAPGVARVITRQFGVSDDMFQYLRRPNLTRPELNGKMLIDRSHEESLMRLNLLWNRFSFNLEKAALHLGKTLEPAFERLLPIVTNLVERFVLWIDRVASADPEFKGLRDTITKVTEALLIAGPVLTATATILKTIEVVLAAIAALSSPLGLVAAAVTTIAAGAAYLGRGFDSNNPTDAQRMFLNSAGSGQDDYAAWIMSKGRQNAQPPQKPSVTVNVGDIHVTSPDPAKAGDSVFDTLTKKISQSFDQTLVYQ